MGDQSNTWPFSIGSLTGPISLKIVVGNASISSDPVVSVDNEPDIEKEDDVYPLGEVENLKDKSVFADTTAMLNPAVTQNEITVTYQLINQGKVVFEKEIDDTNVSPKTEYEYEVEIEVKV